MNDPLVLAPAVEQWNGAARALPKRSSLCGHAVGDGGYAASNTGLCPVCGAEDPPGMHSLRWRDYCPDKNLRWGSCELVRTRNIPPRAPQRGRFRVLEDLLADMATGHGHSCNLRDAALRPAPRAPRHAAPSFTAWRVPARGCTVASGTIILPAHGILLLLGHGARFHRVAFSGGVVMCGADYSGTFDHCTFSECALYIVHGARATLRSCTLSSARPAIAATGAGTAVFLIGCTVAACPTGVFAAQGASLLARRCRITGTGTCLIIHDADSRADLDAVRLDDGPIAHVSVYGVIMLDGALCMRRCTVSELMTAVRACGRRARVEIHDSYSEGCRQPVHIAGGTATLRDVDMRARLIDSEEGRARRSTALRAGTRGAYAGPTDGRACMQAEQCNVEHLSGLALCAADSSRVSMHACYLYSSDNAVDVVSSNVVMSCCFAASLAIACAAEDGSVCACSCELEGGEAAALAVGARMACIDTQCRCSVLEDSRYVVGAVNAACMRLLRCRVSSGVTGVLMQRATCTAVATAVFDIKGDSDPHGVPDTLQAAYECRGGWLEVRGGAMRGCGVGVVVKCPRDSEGTAPGRAQVSGALFERLRRCALIVFPFCSSDMMDCTIRGNYCGDGGDLAQLAAEAAQARACRPGVDGGGGGPNAAARFHGARRGCIRGCHFEGNVAEVYAMVMERLEIVDCVFVKNRVGETVLCVDERTVVRGCRTREEGQAANCSLPLKVDRTTGCVVTCERSST